MQKKFVCVRLVQANSMDLSLFQFDYDLTFAAFFLNADRTIYGRFGTRSTDQDAEKDISLEGYRQALQGALDLHKSYPANAAALRGKKGPAPKFPVPEEFPALKGKYRPQLDYAGNVARSCLHCHQVREAERSLIRSSGADMAPAVLRPWPMPDVLGLSLDPKERARVRAVAPGSAAFTAGFKAGDEIVTLSGQPLLSIADVQWVLHQAGTPSQVAAEVRRGGRVIRLQLPLAEKWRQPSEISWRPTSWDLRRMATGGLVLKDASKDQRQKAGISEDALALLVEYVGQFGEHAAGKRAGFLENDLIIQFNGRQTRMTETDLMEYVLNHLKPGARVPVTILREGQERHLQLPIQ